MRENRPSGLMRGGKQTVIGHTAFQSVASCLLYTSMRRREWFRQQAPLFPAAVNP